MSNCIIGADIGGSHITVALIDAGSWQIVEGSELCVRVDPDASARKILRRWSRIIRRAIRASKQRVCDVGLAMPGPFDYVRGIALFDSDVRKFSALRGMDVGAELRRRIRRSGNIRFINDASAFALGEAMAGAGRGVGRVMALTLGTGFGSGFVVDGAIVDSGDEVPPNGWVYNLPFGGSIADDEFTTRWFVRRYLELSGKEVAGAREVFGHMDCDPTARQTVEEYGARLAEFILPMYSRFSGEAVVVGGNIARSFDLFAAPLARRLTELGATVDIRPAQLFDRAALVGAASIFKTKS